jgi:hypothetical protein
MLSKRSTASANATCKAASTFWICCSTRHLATQQYQMIEQLGQQKAMVSAQGATQRPLQLGLFALQFALK